jgi:hypothetical protein
MTMHLVRGMSTTSTKKRKSRNKTKSLLNAEASLNKYYSKLGLGKSNACLDIPDYRQHKNTIPTAGSMIGNGSRKESTQYTGTDIVGIATMHKSNAVPIRRGTNEAIEIANMGN